jgi:hypothetical protein
MSSTVEVKRKGSEGEKVREEKRREEKRKREKGNV